MDAIFGKPHWVVFNCLTGETTAADQLPFEVGSGEAVDLRLTGAGVAPKHFALCMVKDHGMCLAKRDAAAPIILNGSLVEFSELALNTDYALLAGTELLLIRGGRKINTWSAGLRAAEWHLYDPAAKKREGPFAWQDLPFEKLLEIVQPDRDLSRTPILHGCSIGRSRAAGGD